jgi:hypothetical protein
MGSRCIRFFSGCVISEMDQMIQILQTHLQLVEVFATEIELCDRDLIHLIIGDEAEITLDPIGSYRLSHHPGARETHDHGKGNTHPHDETHNPRPHSLFTPFGGLQDYGSHLSFKYMQKACHMEGAKAEKA